MCLYVKIFVNGKYALVLCTVNKSRYKVDISVDNKGIKYKILCNKFCFITNATGGVNLNISCRNKFFSDLCVKSKLYLKA